jgi:hypothetical protein
MAKRGRPPKFKSVKELQSAIDAYFEKCDEDKEPYTVTGLALALDTTRQTLFEYEDKNGFTDPIKRAKAKCEHWLLEKAIQNKVPQPIAIFVLKNFGWTDKQEIEHTTTEFTINVETQD